jgi:hypothetical protein
MVYTLSYQMYMQGHGRSDAEQRAADARVGETAAELRDLRLWLLRAFRPKHRVRPGRGTVDAVTAPSRVLPSAR